MNLQRTLTSLVALFLLLATLLTSCAPAITPPAYEEEEVTTTAEEESVSTTAEKIIMQADPANDKILNVLIIGNSFSTGWPDELNGLLAEAGVKAQIFTVYYSGCTLSMHWNWLQTGRKNYRLRHHKQEGGIEDDTEVGMEFCLNKRNWDVIAVQHSYGACLQDGYDAEDFHKRANDLAKKFFDYLKENHPKSQLVWHEEWAYNVEWSRNGVSVGTLERQQMMYDNIHRHSKAVYEQNGTPVVPSGAAWQIARANPKIGDLTRDGYHDGPTQGGQYLNALVWYECLTGLSCLDTTWTPSGLTISQEEIDILKNAAHEAVQTCELR